MGISERIFPLNLWTGWKHCLFKFIRGHFRIDISSTFVVWKEALFIKIRWWLFRIYISFKFVVSNGSTGYLNSSMVISELTFPFFMLIGRRYTGNKLIDTQWTIIISQNFNYFKNVHKYWQWKFSESRIFHIFFYLKRSHRHLNDPI